MSVSTLDWPDAAVSIPASVRDLDSFREWAHSKDFPRHVQLTYIRGEIIVDMPWLDVAVSIPASVRDLNSFREWAHSEQFPQGGKITFLGGEILIDMSPQEIETHAKVKGDIYIDLGHFVREQNLGRMLPDPTLLINEDADLSSEPDAIFSSWDSLVSGRVAYRERREASGRHIDLVGSPDMVLEVVSRSSFDKDSRKLAVKYFKAGIDEYWLVDARGKEIDFRILVRSKNRYRKQPTDADGFIASKVFSRRFQLTRGPEPGGGYQYRLEIQPLQPTRAR
jgi:Uma2 family endonuclease